MLLGRPLVSPALSCRHLLCASYVCAHGDWSEAIARRSQQTMPNMSRPPFRMKRKAAQACADAQSAFGEDVARMMAEPDEGGYVLNEDGADEEVSAPEKKKKKVGKAFKLSKCPVCLKSVEHCGKWSAESTTKQGKRILEGPGCWDCLQLYEDGNYSMRSDRKMQTFTNFCDEASRNESFRNELQSALQIQSKAAKRSFDDEECCWVVQEGWRAETYYEGVSVKTFAEKHGCSVNAAGYKVQDLLDPKGKMFKGLLQRDSSMPHVKYVKYADHMLCRRVARLPYGRSVDAKQGQEVYKHNLASEGKKGMWHKLACCSISSEDIAARAASRLRKDDSVLEKLGAGAKSSDDEDEDGDEDSCEGSNESGEEEDNDTGGEVCVKPEASSGSGPTGIASTTKGGSKCISSSTGLEHT